MINRGRLLVSSTWSSIAGSNPFPGSTSPVTVVSCARISAETLQYCKLSNAHCVFYRWSVATRSAADYFRCLTARPPDATLSGRRRSWPGMLCRLIWTYICKQGVLYRYIILKHMWAFDAVLYIMAPGQVMATWWLIRYSWQRIVSTKSTWNANFKSKSMLQSIQILYITTKNYEQRKDVIFSLSIYE